MGLGMLLMAVGCQQNPSEPVADSRQNDYALFDANGGFHRFSRYNDHKAIVLWVQGNGCPIVRNAMTDFKQLVADYEQENVVFFMLNSNLQDDRIKVQAEAKAYDFPVPVLMDEAQLLAEALDITLTSEVLILHPTTRNVLFRGPINNRLDYEAQRPPTETYARNALNAILEDTPLPESAAMAKGCTVTRKSEINEEPFTYTEDIAPILTNHCTRCHKDDGIAPWSMTDYQTIHGWSSTIKQVLLSKRMPPWKADPHIGDFKNDFSLTDSSAYALYRWIETGMERGPGEDTLSKLPQKTKAWPLGTPDTIITLKPEKIPATGIVPYRYQTFSLGLKEDTWLQGVGIQPGSTKAVHHIVLTNKETNKKSLIVNRPARPWTDNYIALGGGIDQNTMFPEGTGVFLKKGTELTIQIHYTPTGKEEEDRTQLGFYYYDTPPEKEFYALSPSNTTFTIPPHSSNVTLTVADTLTKDIDIHYLVPHMHYRGTSMRMSVIAPSGEQQTLISVPDYNFNWQYLYKLKEPIRVTKGSVILVEGTYDNSWQNPLNPDPSKELHFGIQSTDEMLIGFLNYTLAEPHKKTLTE